MKDGKELLLKILKNYDQLEKEPKLFECGYKLLPHSSFVYYSSFVYSSIDIPTANLMKELYGVSQIQLIEIFRPVAIEMKKASDNLAKLIKESSNGVLEVEEVEL